jgi:hypothetical protein
MKADIKYTVKYHSLPSKKIGTIVFSFGVIIIVLLDLIWAPFKSLTPELQALTMFYIMPKLYWDFHAIAFLSMTLGGCIWLFKWRTGKLEVTDEKLIIKGSYDVSIWLKNMWEIDFRANWNVRLDSNVDAVEIKFKTEKEFKDFSDALIRLMGQLENIKLKDAI